MRPAHRRREPAAAMARIGRQVLTGKKQDQLVEAGIAAKIAMEDSTIIPTAAME